MGARDNQDQLIDGYWELNQNRLINQTLDKTEIRVAF